MDHFGVWKDKEFFFFFGCKIEEESVNVCKELFPLMNEHMETLGDTISCHGTVNSSTEQLQTDDTSPLVDYIYQLDKSTLNMKLILNMIQSSEAMVMILPPLQKVRCLFFGHIA